MGKEILMGRGSKVLIMILIMTSCSPSKEQESKSSNSVDSQQELIGFDDIQLYKKELIGIIKNTEIDWMLVSGTSCIQCDENQSLYLIPIVSKEADTNKLARYSYPGKVFYYEDNSLIFESRVFWGECSEDTTKVVYWVQRELNDEEKWEESVYEVKITGEGLKGSSLPNSDVFIDHILNKVSQGVCYEIPGIEQTSEP